MFALSHPVIDIAVVCSDFDESLRFYAEKLGMEVALEIDIPEDVAVGAKLAPRKFRQVRLKAGQTLIKLMEIDSPPAKRSDRFEAGVRWLTFLVPDVRAAMEELRGRGVEFLSEPVSAPDARAVVCTQDPDGLLIELVQVE